MKGEIKVVKVQENVSGDSPDGRLRYFGEDGVAKFVEAGSSCAGNPVPDQQSNYHGQDRLLRRVEGKTRA